MKEKLTELLKNAYAPYSNYSVSAIVSTNDGKLFYGVNVENASYGSTICAEKSAIVSAVTHGYKKGNFSKLYVMVGSGEIGTPCFSCRQIILEFFDLEDEVICMNTLGEEVIYKVSELCPYPFSKEDLI